MEKTPLFSGNHGPCPQLKNTPFLHEITDEHGFHFCAPRAVHGLSMLCGEINMIPSLRYWTLFDIVSVMLSSWSECNTRVPRRNEEVPVHT